MPEDEQGHITETGKRLIHLQEIIQGYVKILLWVTVVLFVVAIISLIRSFQVNESIDNLGTATDDAKEASVEARDALKQAIADIEKNRAEGDNVPSGEIVAALEAVARIEEYLCDGPCDAVEQP